MRIDSLLTRFAVLSRMVSRVWYCLPVDNGALVVVVVVRNSVCTSKRYICWYQWPRGLKRGSAAARFLALRVRILLGAWLLSLVCAVCCQVEVSALGWSLDQRGPTDCGVSECDREASIMRRPWPTGGAGGGCRAKNKHFVELRLRGSADSEFCVRQKFFNALIFRQIFKLRKIPKTTRHVMYVLMLWRLRVSILAAENSITYSECVLVLHLSGMHILQVSKS